MSRKIVHASILDIAEDICGRNGSAQYHSIYWTDASGILNMVADLRINLKKGTKNGPRRSENMSYVTVHGRHLQLNSETNKWSFKGIGFRTVPMATLVKWVPNDNLMYVAQR